MLLAKEGNKEAFEQIYHLYFAPIYRYIYFRVRSKEMAEDLTQTVFLKVYQSISRFRARQDFSPLAYFFTVARNVVIDYWRKKKEVILDQENLSWLDMERQDKTLSDVKVKIEAKDLIQDGLKQLNPEQQEVIILRFIDELSNKEIAALLGKTEVAVRQLQCRALKILRLYFKGTSRL